MDISVINSSITSTEQTQEEYWQWLFTDGYIATSFEVFLLILEIIGIVGIALVFLVARHMVNVEMKTGTYVIACS